MSAWLRAIAQVPTAWRGDLLVTVDGALASHGLLDHLTALNTAAPHGRRGRRVTYSVGWPVVSPHQDRDRRIGRGRLDHRTDSGRQRLPRRLRSWSRPGLVRHSAGGDQLAGRPPDLRVIARLWNRRPPGHAEHPAHPPTTQHPVCLPPPGPIPPGGVSVKHRGKNLYQAAPSRTDVSCTSVAIDD